MSTLANRIKDRREQLRMTQSDLAQKIDRDQKQVWRYENSDSQPNATSLLELAIALETTTDYLVGLTENPSRPLRDAHDLTDMERRLIADLRALPDDVSKKLLAFLEAVR